MMSNSFKLGENQNSNRHLDVIGGQVMKKMITYVKRRFRRPRASQRRVQKSTMMFDTETTMMMMMFVFLIAILLNTTTGANLTTTTATTSVHRQGGAPIDSPSKSVKSTTATSNTTSKFKQDPPQSAPIDFVVFKDRELGGNTQLTAQNSTKTDNHSETQALNRQLERHSYNLTASANDLDRNSTATKSLDPLDVSDSRPQVRRYDPPPQDEYDEGPYGGSSSADDSSLEDEGYIDGASSNLSEKKVVKELTKILSKGMSGATEGVRMETLENLKRRTRERKALKENRAKLFEEILTTAINNHPDKQKKSKSKSKMRNSSNNLKSSASSSGSSSPSLSQSAGLFNNPEVDPELASDAENVLQHLNGLSSAIDAHLPTSNYQGGDDTMSPTPTNSGESETDDSSAALSGATDSSDSDAADQSQADEKPKKAVASSERPIVRQFKKIKSQLSQRRKQLDQIKKMFNMELSLNPKDGSLMSRPVQSKKKQQGYDPQQDQSTQDDGSASMDESPSAGKRTKTSPGQSAKGDKARELLMYLRENPEILASVMAELTVDADPSANRGFNSTPDEPSHQSNADPDEPGLRSRSQMSAKNPTKFHQQQLIDPDDIIWSRQPTSTMGRASRTSLSSGARLANQDYDLGSPTLTRRRRTKIFGDHASAITNRLSSRQRSAEALLLETLRERQLLNLARIDLILAERAVSNKSVSSGLGRALLGGLNITGNPLARPPVYAAPDPMGQNSRRSNEDQNDPDWPMPRRHNLSSQQQTTGRRNEQAALNDDGLTHHFMMVNPNYNGSDPIGRQLNSNEYINSFNSQAQLHQTNTNSGPSQSYSQPNQIQQGSNQQQLRYNQQTQQLQAPLKRFRDWQDVSQSDSTKTSEASSWQYDKLGSQLPLPPQRYHDQQQQQQQPNANLSWLPYDLTTGSSSSTSIEAQSMKAPSNVLGNRMQQANVQLNYLRESTSSANMQPTQQADSSQVSGQSQVMPQQHNSYHNHQHRQREMQREPNTTLTRSGYMNQAAANDSIFMTRSSAAEPDVSTVKLASYDESHRNQQMSKSHPHVDFKPDEPREESQGAEAEVRRSEDYESSRAGDQGPTRPADYFRSYKDEELTVKRRLRPRQQLQAEVNPFDSDTSGPEMDNTGAMW